MSYIKRIRIRGGRVIDPSQGLDEILDICLADKRVVALGEAPDFQADEVIDATGLVVCPGLVDLRVHLREPGQEHKGTIASETAAAAAGGITTVCVPPDTVPIIDTPAVAELIKVRANQSDKAWVLTLGALTKGLAGEQISEMAALQTAGCVGVSNGLRQINNTLILRRAMEYAATFGLTVFLHPQDPWLSASGCAHEGVISERLGLPGIPVAAETVAVTRALVLAEQDGIRIHFTMLSAARSVEMLAEAQARGLPVTADVAIHQLHLTELDIADFNAQCHVLPPLRSQYDRDILRVACASGVVSAICSDHQPHEPDAKLAPFCETEPGISGLETLLPLGLRLVHNGILDLSTLISRLSWQPSSILGQPYGTLQIGARADVCLFDLERRWTLDAARLISRGHNTPFHGWELKGRVIHTLMEGRRVFDLEDIHQPC
ncbi:Dihydroorotase-like protein [Gammaproteobacteria bacterium]